MKELFPNKGAKHVDLQGKARLSSELYGKYYERENVADRYWGTILKKMEGVAHYHANSGSFSSL